MLTWLLGSFLQSRSPGSPDKGTRLQPEGPLRHTFTPVLIKAPLTDRGCKLLSPQAQLSQSFAQGTLATCSPKVYPKGSWEWNRSHEDPSTPDSYGSYKECEMNLPKWHPSHRCS